ncbi:MAG TPA: hypothetical protein PKV98_10765 [Burkholderiaceae bacterium]|nr:hypothetical protein [Burkholderiaceae bacterium]
MLAPLARSVAPGLDLLVPGRCELRDGVVWIAVESAAESAKLRQATPRMLASLSEHGLQVYEIKTRVQASGTSYPGQGRDEASSRGTPFSEVTNRGVSAVETAALEMPDSALARALRRLATTLARRRDSDPSQAG